MKIVQTIRVFLEEISQKYSDNTVRDYEGEKIGPVQVTKEIAEHLKKDDTINLVVGRIGKKWIPLEVGNVYPG